MNLWNDDEDEEYGHESFEDFQENWKSDNKNTFFVSKNGRGGAELSLFGLKDVRLLGNKVFEMRITFEEADELRELLQNFTMEWKLKKMSRGE